jgi:peroxiredoxin
MPAPDFTLTDQAGAAWAFADRRTQAAHVLLFLRGDW